jgi:hypothetical protein
MLATALLQEQRFGDARQFLEGLDIRRPAAWEFERSDTGRDSLDEFNAFEVRPSPELLLLYLTTARSFARLATQEFKGAALWSEIAEYVGSTGLLEDLDWGAGSPFEMAPLPDKASARISAEVARLGSLESWRLRSELDASTVLLGLSVNSRGGPTVFGESAHGKFSVSSSASGGGSRVIFRRDQQCHHDYLNDFQAIAARYEKHRDTFEMASVILSNGERVMQLEKTFAKSLRLSNASGSPTDHFVVSQEDVAKLHAGRRVADSSNLAKVMANLQASSKALVFWEHPLAQKAATDNPNGQAEMLHQFVASLNVAYPGLGIFKELPGDNLAARVADLQAARMDRMPVRVVIDLGFGAPLTEASNKVARRFGNRPGIEVIDYLKDTLALSEADQNTSAMTFIITGSSGEHLATLVRDLGSKGFLKNKFVVFEACGTALTAGLVAEILGRYGAKAAYHFSGRVNPDDAASLLEQVLTKKSTGMATRVRSVPSEAIKALPRKPVLPMLGAWTTCSNMRQPGAIPLADGEHV